MLPISKLIRKPLEIFRRSEHDQRTLSHNEFYFDKTEVSQDVENITLAKPNITIQYQKFSMNTYKKVSIRLILKK